MATDDLVSAYERDHAGRISALAFARGYDAGMVGGPDAGGLDVAALVAAARRFPWSRRVRDALWGRIVRHGRYELVAELRAAATASGAAVSARLLIHDGERRFDAGDVAGAVTQFEAAATDDPTCAEAWNDLGVALNAMGRPQAVEALRVGLAVGGPDGSDCLLNRALVLAHAGRLAEARRDAAVGLTYDPGNAELEEIHRTTSHALAGMSFDARMRAA